MIRVALNDFQIRVENMKSLDILKASTALDPWFESLKSINKESREDVSKFIRCAVEQSCNKQTDADEQSGGGGGYQSKCRAKLPRKKPRLILTCNDSESEECGGHCRQRIPEVQRRPKKSESHDPLLWWKVNSYRFPKLASFVRTVLCI